jgi:Protein of unknown function (DUF2442)
MQFCCVPNGGIIMAITDPDLQSATRRGAAKKAAFSGVSGVRFDTRRHRLVISLHSGLELVCPPGAVPGLEKARSTDFKHFEISPSGMGLHFPDLDADVYIPALLSGLMGSKNWLASEMGKAGGQQSSEAKAKASKANGKLGGRPKKIKAAN